VNYFWARGTGNRIFPPFLERYEIDFVSELTTIAFVGTEIGKLLKSFLPYVIKPNELITLTAISRIQIVPQQRNAMKFCT
jgi:hypothetical protein